MFKIITVPFDRNKKGFDEEVLTRFILNKEIISYRARFFEDGAEKFWSVFLEYDPVSRPLSCSPPVAETNNTGAAAGGSPYFFLHTHCIVKNMRASPLQM